MEVYKLEEPKEEVTALVGMGPSGKAEMQQRGQLQW